MSKTTSKRSKQISTKSAQAEPPSPFERAPPSIQPFLDTAQLTPGGIPRVKPVPMVMVTGGAATMRAFERAKAVGVKRRLWYTSQGIKIDNLIVL